MESMFQEQIIQLNAHTRWGEQHQVELKQHVEKVTKQLSWFMHTGVLFGKITIKVYIGQR